MYNDCIKILTTSFSPVFRLYLVSTSWIVPFKTTTSYTEHKTRKSKYEIKKLKHRNQNVIAQNTMSHIGFRTYITWLFALCKGGNFNIHIWVWFGYFIC